LRPARTFPRSSGRGPIQPTATSSLPTFAPRGDLVSNRSTSRNRGTVFIVALAVLCAAIAFGGPIAGTSAGVAQAPKPTVVLIHGAFADGSSWDGVISRLRRQGYPVIAPANPLRGLRSDSDYIRSILSSIRGPIVLVGHSYGGMVISNAATGNRNVKALVYVAGFAPERGESALWLSNRFPGSTLAQTLFGLALPGGGTDLYIRRDVYPRQFAADLPAARAALMAVTQRPITQAALADPSGAAAWRSIPSWFVFGSADRNIPPALHRFMADRAHARRTVEIRGASHAVPVSHPTEVATLITEAATSRSASRPLVPSGHTIAQERTRQQ
jgi:pimeloyl-ACP methyl ester carboxylesterase